MTWNEFKKRKLEELRLELSQYEGQVDRDFEEEGYLRGQLNKVEDCNGFTDFIRFCTSKNTKMDARVLKTVKLYFNMDMICLGGFESPLGEYKEEFFIRGIFMVEEPFKIEDFIGLHFSDLWKNGKVDPLIIEGKRGNFDGFEKG